LNLTATVIVKGDPALLREYRSRVNELIAEDDGFVSSIVPTRDGLMVALRIA